MIGIAALGRACRITTERSSVPLARAPFILRTNFAVRGLVTPRRLKSPLTVRPRTTTVGPSPPVVGSLPSVTLHDELTQGEDRVRALGVSGNLRIARTGGLRQS